MRISLLQPDILNGEIEHNLSTIQRLVDSAEGDLIVLPEYALTGAVGLRTGADIHDWVQRSALAKRLLAVPDGKIVLINTLVETDAGIQSCTELLPTGQQQPKLILSDAERAAGIVPGTGQRTFDLFGNRFKVMACATLESADAFDLEELDFAIWVFHFTNDNYARAMADVKRVSEANSLRILVSSLVNGRSIGLSAYVDGHVQLVLPRREGILEVIVA
jgi:predicted amidohydrolase